MDSPDTGSNRFLASPPFQQLKSKAMLDGELSVETEILMSTSSCLLRFFWPAVQSSISSSSLSKTSATLGFLGQFFRECLEVTAAKRAEEKQETCVWITELQSPRQREQMLKPTVCAL
jgi:hypothetical protein